MNLKFLETFLWAARLNSFNMAAKKLHASPAAVSARIAALEEELGVKLFDRKDKNIELTNQGSAALAEADRILRIVSDFKERLGGRVAQENIKIGVTDGVALVFFPSVVKVIKARYPRLNLEMRIDTSNNLAQMLQRGQLELALLMGTVSGPEIVSKHLYSVPATCVAKPSLVETPSPITLEELQRLPFIGFPIGSIPYEDFRSLFPREVFQSMQISTSNSISVTMKMVRSGLGVTILPRDIVASDIKSGALQELNLAYPLPDFSFRVAFIDTPDNALIKNVADLLSINSKQYEMEPK